MRTVQNVQYSTVSSNFYKFMPPYSRDDLLNKNFKMQLFVSLLNVKTSILKHIWLTLVASLATSSLHLYVVNQGFRKKHKSDIFVQN